jgi:glycosyltransferase involved in cell wall biosynthesis
MKYRVSVVVPSFGRVDLLKRCIHALLAQNFPAETYEIIIADDADIHQTKQLVEDLACFAQSSGRTLRYLPLPKTHRAHGPAAARNAGWRTADAEFIAFTDDDCIPTENWLHAGVSAFIDEIVAVSGQVIVPLPAQPTDYESNAAQLTQGEFVTANCFYRRATLAEVGGFDERFTSAWREDSDLFFTLLEHQKCCVFAPTAIVCHPVRKAPWGISLAQQRKSMFNALLYKKHPMLYRQRIQATPPWHYYRIVGCLFLILLSPVIRSRHLGLCALLAWISMTTHFCITRLRCTSHTPIHILEMIVTSSIIPLLAIFWRLRGALKFHTFFL